MSGAASYPVELGCCCIFWQKVASPKTPEMAALMVLLALHLRELLLPPLVHVHLQWPARHAKRITTHAAHLSN